MAFMIHKLVSPLPIYGMVISFFVYHLIRILSKLVYSGEQFAAGKPCLDQAEKGDSKLQEDISDDEGFQLEKRAFFSTTWLFVCHSSRFARAGDYHAYNLAGIQFFVVLSKDHKLRAFHNVCRHRAYTVVRKSCGNSSRFSCKYHGWQYDDTGSLIKAPKFDQSPGFVPEDNGLFEVKLITTNEGFVFVNFDASTMHLPFDNVRSHVQMGSCSWVDGNEISCARNWKAMASEFSNQVRSSQRPSGWFPSRRNVVRLLGPMSLIRELDRNLWCTLVLLPLTKSETMVRYDVFAREGYSPSARTMENCTSGIRQELNTLCRLDKIQASSTCSKYFAYQCGGRTIDLFAILAQHQRTERMAKRKLQPAIRVTGTADIDREAEAICDALDSGTASTSLEKCSRMSSFSRTVEW